MSRKPPLIGRRESSDVLDPVYLIELLTNVDSTLSTMLQRCANNVLSDSVPHPLYG